MAKTNRERVGEIMDLLKSGLGPYTLRQYRFVYQSKHLQEMEYALHSGVYSVHLPDASAALAEIDTQGWLKLIFNRWNDVFKQKLGHSERSYVSELMEARVKWAHQKAFSNDEAQRVADTAKLLLEAVNATDQAASAARHSNELLRIRYEREADRSSKLRTIISPETRSTDAALKPWRQVIEPHPDVRSGRFQQAEFAADLAAVIRGEAGPEYQEARPFFDRTYMTEGLRDLVVNGIKRLTGTGGDPVVQLQTNFGGGKTHSMLALYHAFSAGFKLSDLRDFDDIRNLLGDIDDDITARRAVIVGTSFNVSVPRQRRDCSTRTIWGEIAYQLGGAAAYELVEANDLQGTNPGADTLVALLENHGPALIILDELVRLTQNVYMVSPAPAAGSFEAILAFMQSLTEAVKRASDALLLVSIPASDIEIGGEGGHSTLAKLRQTLGRLESVWKPVSKTEGYEIVRRRLFSDVSDYPARDAVVNRFHQMYKDNQSDYPQNVSEADYRREMKQSYPIHPELFERLYEDWSTLERFQRTRGVLRMMAAVIHQLWMDQDQSLMIMPGDIPLYNKDVESEVTKYLLPQNFSPVVAADIDGSKSKPFAIDKEVKQLGKYTASRRVARAIFMGSSPAKATPGIEERRINLATVQPGERAAAFGDALRRMVGLLNYLYHDGARYWYATRPTVNRVAQDRAQDMDDYKILEAAGKRLRAQKWDKSAFASVHFLPESSAEIPDEQSARLVVLAPEHSHKRNDETSAAMTEARDILENRGNSPRHHRNMLIFIAPDATRNSEWQDSIRMYLAWDSIKRDIAQLNLDVQQIKQVEQNLKRESEAVDTRLQETYRWLLVPDQPDRMGAVTLSPTRLPGSDDFLQSAARKLKSQEWLIYKLSPDNLLEELKPLNIWADAPHLSLKKLWSWLTNYCYLPRLADRTVLEATIHDGVSRLMPAFGYATGIDEDGKYSGLELRHPFTLYFDDKSLIVEEKTARAQIGPPIIGPIIDPPPPPPPPPPPCKKKRRYYGSVAIDPLRAMNDLGTIVDEIILNLAALPGADVKITLEIEALHSSGFDSATERTISENSSTLRFSEHNFEE